MADRSGRRDPLTTLSALLRTALDLTSGLARDRNLARLLGAFAQFPPGDRAVVFASLETEVHARQRSVELGDHLVGPPNPMGSVYLRVYEGGRPQAAVTRDTMLRSTIQSIALIGTFPDDARTEVEDSILSGMATLGPDDADALARHYEDLLALAAAEPPAPA